MSQALLMNSINPSKLPQHVAIIMDGNGRWAKARGLPRVEGHREGTRISEEIITYARDLGIRYLTLYAFSRENWNRPPEEVYALMRLLEEFLLEKKKKMIDNGIRLNAIGHLFLLPDPVRLALSHVMEETQDGKDMVLTLALSYGSRDEIIRAISKLVKEKKSTDEISVEEFEKHLDTFGMPDPDLIIRTSGEYRMSNFLLWQGAYAEYVFEECLWPDFTPKHLIKAIHEYQNRERRYGKTSEQLK